jgi:meiotic recombination protein SPO11
VGLPSSSLTTSLTASSIFLIFSRDIYYKDPSLFLKQDVVDKYVDDIACTFGVERGRLNVVRLPLHECLPYHQAHIDGFVPDKVATAKGLVAGALKIMRKDGSTLDCASGNEARLPRSNELFSKPLRADLG